MNALGRFLVWTAVAAMIAGVYWWSYELHKNG